MGKLRRNKVITEETREKMFKDCSLYVTVK